jgi:hypothetical protein
MLVSSLECRKPGIVLLCIILLNLESWILGFDENICDSIEGRRNSILDSSSDSSNIAIYLLDT